jgi:hypothetical protein
MDEEDIMILIFCCWNCRSNRKKKKQHSILILCSFFSQRNLLSWFIVFFFFFFFLSSRIQTKSQEEVANPCLTNLGGRRRTQRKISGFRVKGAHDDDEKKKMKNRLEDFWV